MDANREWMSCSAIMCDALPLEKHFLKYIFWGGKSMFCFGALLLDNIFILIFHFKFNTMEFFKHLII